MKTLLLFLYLFTLGAGWWLSWLNRRHLERFGSRVPEGFEGAISPEDLERVAAYTVARSRLGLAEAVWDALWVLLFFFGGLLSWYDGAVGALTDSFLGGGVLFFLGLALAQGALALPFSLYRTFVLEARFGFNTTTWRLWLADLLKSTLLSAVLLSALAAGALALVQASPRWWWLWVWGFFAVVSLFLIYLSPVLIEPLFFKFEPVRDEALKARIGALMARAGLRVKAVQQVDASRRSRHSNAFFSGLGRVKRIVLFDTLIEQMSEAEILAVLAHEAGHWKKGHLLQRLAAAELLSLALCWLAYRLLQWGGLPGLLGAEGLSFFAQVTIVGLLASLGSFFLTPLGSGWSRRHERQADAFAARLGGEPEALASALVKLSRENLANLHPHPLYAWFHFSHPPVVDRVRRLRRRNPDPAVP